MDRNRDTPQPRWEGLIFNFNITNGIIGYNININTNSSFSAGNFIFYPIFSGINGVGPIIKFPYTSGSFFINSLFTTANLSVIRTSYSSGASGGTLSGTSGSRIATINLSTGNTLAIGTIITVGGVNHTICGLGRATGGTCTGTAGTATLTLDTVTGYDTYVQAGMAIVIGVNEYLVISTANTQGATTGTTCTLHTNLVTSPAGTPFTSVTGLGVAGTNLTYTVTPALTATYTSSTFTISQDAFNWVYYPC